MIRVMIVEDDPMVASVNETYLSRLPGFCVIAKAADGLQALEKIKALSGSVDLVLLDVFMPKMDGLAVMEKFANDKSLKKIPSFIVVSAVGQERITENAFNLGADYYILKPFDLSLIHI